MTRLPCVLFFSAFNLCAQPRVADMAFDVASVKPSHPASNWIRAIKNDTRGRVTYENFALKDLIRDAYGLKDYQIKGPAWLRTERFDIVATKSRGATPGKPQLTLRSVLQDRFQLATHMEKKELPGYVLRPGKDTSKLRPAIGVQALPGCQSFGPMSDFANLLSRRLDRPVANETGISGDYFFILAWSDQLSQGSSANGAVPPPAPAAPPPCPGWSAATMPPLAASIFEAVKDQMGLKLEGSRQKIAVDLLIVDSAQKLPTPN